MTFDSDLSMEENPGETHDGIGLGKCFFPPAKMLKRQKNVKQIPNNSMYVTKKYYFHIEYFRDPISHKIYEFSSSSNLRIFKVIIIHKKDRI